MYKTLEGHPWTPLVIMVPGYKKKKKFFFVCKVLNIREIKASVFLPPSNYRAGALEMFALM